jgi:uncharacterized protein
MRRVFFNKLVVCSLFLLISIVIFSNLCYAIPSSKTGNIKLLAVQETENGFEGNIADLYLEVIPGDGRIYIDTFPLSKIDTQISTRFAKEIVCDYLDVDCSKYDFFYTIRSNSVIIGGPSAGAAIASLTYSVLSNKEIDSSVAMTGTINSGGLIGPVSGVKEKIEAAAKNGLNQVLIPGGTSVIIDENNESFDLIEYGESINITVNEVYSLDDAIFVLTGERISTDENVNLPQEYYDTMKIIADDLCSQTYNLITIYSDMSFLNSSINDSIVLNVFNSIAENLTSSANESYIDENYYSAASYCFGANIRYRNMILIKQNLTDKMFAEKVLDLDNKILGYESMLDNLTIRTLNDMQIYMIIDERVENARLFLESAKNTYYDSKYDSLYNLAYAIERFNSIKSWEQFLGLPGAEFELNEAMIQQSCSEKIAEAQERYQYVSLFISPQIVSQSLNDINLAMDYYEKQDYLMCIMKASIAKSNINVVSGIIGISEEKISDLVDRKLNSVKKMIVREQNKDIFPIMGYSYYEYAKSLKESDLYSSLIYAEEALELSSLSIYFKENEFSIRNYVLELDKLAIMTFLLGVSVGFLVVIMYYSKKELSSSRFAHRRLIKRKVMRK